MLQVDFLALGPVVIDVAGGKLMEACSTTSWRHSRFIELRLASLAEERGPYAHTFGVSVIAGYN